MSSKRLLCSGCGNEARASLAGAEARLEGLA